MKTKILILMFCVVLIAGCAKTITPIVDYGEQMIVKVTLRGTMDQNNNRYFLVLSSNNGLKIPLPPPDNIDYEMIEPGSIPTYGSLEAYYTNYYSTWGSYIILDPAGYSLVNGPFVLGQATTRETLELINQVSAVVTYRFDLGKVFGATIPDNIYFDLVTVDWPNGLQKLAADHLTSTNALISKVSGSIVEIDDGSDYNLEPGLDIINCRAEIQ